MSFVVFFLNRAESLNIALTGKYDAARAVIDDVIHNVKTPDEKLNAYTHRIRCLTSETSEYGKGAEMGVEILSKYGIDIPLSPTKTAMAKEEMKYKLALRNRSLISCLTSLPVKDDPLLALCQQFSTCAMCKSINSRFAFRMYLTFILIFYFTTVSGKPDVMKLMNWKLIQYVLKRGSISSNLVLVLGASALMYVRVNDVKRSNEFATTAQSLIPRIRDDKKVYVTAVLPVYMAMCLLQPFRSLSGPLLQAHKDCKVSCD